MTPAKLILVALVTALGADAARAADGNSKKLELCIQTARDTDATCAKLMDDPAQRLECFSKARVTQLDCLEHALAEGAAPGIATSGDATGSSPSEAPASTASVSATSQDKVLENLQEPSQASKAPQETDPHGAEPAGAASSAQATTNEAPPAPAAMPVESKTVAVHSDAPPKEETVKEPVKETAKENAKEITKPDARPSGAQAAQAESRWVISETTSPVDYGPLFVATILPTTRSQDGANSLAVRCRGGRTELIIRTSGTWRAARNSALTVERQINGQAVVRQNWTLAADAKTATYAEDAIGLLQSLPDGALLTLGVPDGANVRRDATFLLAGWDAVRKRAETACKWPKATNEASSGKR